MVVHVCKFPDCDKPAHSKGLCQGHYAQQARGQELYPLRTYRMCPVERATKYRSERDEATGCLLFTGPLNAAGYGRVATHTHQPRQQMLHRLAYELAYGPIPDDHDVHHECFVRNCFEPTHLVALHKSINRAINRCVHCGKNPRVLHQ